MLIPAAYINGTRAVQAQVLPAVDPVAGVSPAAPVDRAAERSLLASLAGRTVTALVLGRADDGHGIVDIGGKRLTVQADLPAPGTSVSLKFAGMPGTALAANPANLSRIGSLPLATLGGNLAANEAPGTDSFVALGAGARSLGRFADTPLTPLALGKVAANIEAPAEWSTALAKMLRESGNFYEAHLAAWTRGRYPLEDIRQEPQAAGGRPAALAAPAGGALTAQDLNAANAGRELPLLPAAASSQAQGVPEELRPVLREQLHTLETQTMPFSIESWPGQRADLVIGREEQDQNGARGSGEASGWKTDLKLHLPQLGRIGATLTLNGDRLWLDLSAPAGSAALMDEAGTALTNALHAAGISLVRTRIHDAAEDLAENDTASAAMAAGNHAV